MVSLSISACAEQPGASGGSVAPCCPKPSVAGTGDAQAPAAPLALETTGAGLSDVERRAAALAMRGQPAQAAQLMQAAGGDRFAEDDAIARAERMDSVLDPWPAPGEREEIDLAYDVTDQDGRAMKLRALTGKPLVVSFLFTRCPNPKMCPFIASRMASLQLQLAASGLGDAARLAIISYDPVYDTPERLKQYAQVRGMRFDNLSLLRPEPAQLTKLLGEFQTPLAFNDSGGVDNHAMDVFILDASGRYVRQYRGAWSNSRILSDLRRLLAEERAAAVSAPAR